MKKQNEFRNLLLLLNWEHRALKFYVFLSMGVGLNHINKGMEADCL